VTGRNFFYTELDVSVTAFPSTAQIKFPFQATRVIIAMNGKADLHFSFQKPNIDGRLVPDDAPLAMDGLSEGRLWFKKVAVGPAVLAIRVWAWRGGVGR